MKLQMMFRTTFFRGNIRMLYEGGGGGGSQGLSLTGPCGRAGGISSSTLSYSGLATTFKSSSSNLTASSWRPNPGERCRHENEASLKVQQLQTEPEQPERGGQKHQGCKRMQEARGACVFSARLAFGPQGSEFRLRTRKKVTAWRGGQ